MGCDIYARLELLELLLWRGAIIPTSSTLMVTEYQALIDDFSAAIAPQRVTLMHDSWPAPHAGRKLPPGKCAVYVFSLSEMYGSNVQAGVHRVLKVGKAGSNCNARFQSQHYNVKSAPSTLAGSLIRTTVLWHYLGIKSLDISGARRWIEQNTDRDNFYIDIGDEGLLGKLEKFMKGRLGPVFEG